MATPGSTIPSEWPSQLDTKYNLLNPMNVSINGTQTSAYISVSFKNIFYLSNQRLFPNYIYIYSRVPLRHLILLVDQMIYLRF